MSEYDDFSQKISPEIIYSNKLIEKIGLLSTIKLVRSQKYPNRNKELYIGMGRIVNPLLLCKNSMNLDNIIKKFKDQMI